MRYPVSRFHQSELDIEVLRPGFLTNPHHTMNITVKITGPLDVDKLSAAYDQLIARNELLRSRPVFDGDSAYQEVVEHRPAALKIVDSDEDWATQQIDVQSPPLIRGFLAHNGQDEHLLGLVLHHFAADPASLRLAVTELAALYNGSLPPLALQYGEYSQWQADRLAAKQAEWTAEWKNVLDGVRPPRYTRDVEFVPGRPADLREIRTPLLSSEQLDGVVEWSRRNRSTIFTTLLAAYTRAIAPRADTDDLILTTVFEQRDHPDAKRLLGPFVYPTVMRLQVREGEDWAAWVARVRASVIDSYQRAQFPVRGLLGVAPQLAPGMIGAEPAWLRFFQYLPIVDDEAIGFGAATGEVVHTGVQQEDQHQVGSWLRVRRTVAGDLAARMAYDANELTEASALALLDDFRSHVSDLLTTSAATARR